MNVQNGLLPLHATGNEKIIVNSHLFFQNVWKTLCCRHNYASAKRSIKKALHWKKSLIIALKWQVDLYELNVSLHSKYQTKKGTVSDKRPPPHKNKIKQTSKTD